MTRQFYLMTEQGNCAVHHMVYANDKGLYLKSYDKIVAFTTHDDGERLVTEDVQTWSKTTRRYAKQFLGVNPEYVRTVPKIYLPTPWPATAKSGDPSTRP